MADPVEVRYCPIRGFPGYRIGDDGTAYSAWRFRGGGYGGTPQWYISDPPQWRQLKPDVRKSDGRQRYTLRIGQGEYVKVQASHLVLNHFVGLQPEGLEACHNDGNCTNNRWDNLRWDTPISNKGDMVRHGTRLSGEDSPVAILNWEIVRAIRARFKAGGIRKCDLAREYNISQPHVGYVISETIWKENNGRANTDAGSDA